MLRAKLVLQALLILLITFEKPEFSSQKFSTFNMLEVIQQLQGGHKLLPQVSVLSVPNLDDMVALRLDNSLSIDIESFNFNNISDIDQSHVQYLDIIQRRWLITKSKVKTMYEVHFLTNLENFLDALF